MGKIEPLCTCFAFPRCEWLPQQNNMGAVSHSSQDEFQKDMFSNTSIWSFAMDMPRGVSWRKILMHLMGANCSPWSHPANGPRRWKNELGGVMWGFPLKCCYNSWMVFNMENIIKNWMITGVPLWLRKPPGYSSGTGNRKKFSANPFLP